jgi:hypothetical protein
MSGRISWGEIADPRRQRIACSPTDLMKSFVCRYLDPIRLPWAQGGFLKSR